MSLHAAATVCRKELLEVVRDRKTLFLTLVLPFVAFPLIVTAMVRYYQYLLESRALRQVVVAAAPDAQAAWRRLVWDWAAHGADQPALRAAQAHFGDLVAFAVAPPEALGSPDALAEWARGQALPAAEGLGRLNRAYIERRTSADPIPEELVDRLRRFQTILVQGLGRVRFVDPAALPEPPGSFGAERVPPEIRAVPGARRLTWAIERRRIQAALAVPPGLDALADSDAAQSQIVLIHDSTIPLSNEAQARFKRAVEAWGKQVVGLRLARHDLSGAFADPVRMAPDMNLASESRQLLAMLAGIVPYLVITFAFLGATAPASDLGAGEKERGTLETLLLTPVTRGQLAVGKFVVILLASLTAGVLSVASLGLALGLLVPSGAMEMLQIGVGVGSIALMATLALPMAATFAGVLLALSIRARSMREAQASIAPISLLLFIPGMAAMLPDLEPTLGLACVPMVNVAVLMREFMKGEMWWGCYALTMATSLALAALCIGYAVRQFKREEVLFRA